MTADMQLNRSYRVVPGNDWEAITEAAETETDAVFLDLEDGVPPSEKDQARRQTISSLSEWFIDGNQYTTVRINSLDTPRGMNDIRTLATASATPDSVCIPKVRGSTELQLVSDLLSSLGTSVRIVAIIEKAAAVFNIYDIAHSTPRLDALIFGSVDFRRSADMPATFSNDSRIDTAAQTHVPRVLLSLAASTAGIAAVDGGYYIEDDIGGLREDAHTARSLGFDGKAATTPEQVPIINDAFGPTDQELAEARKIVQAFREAGDVAKLNVDGVVVEQSHLKQQKNLLRKVHKSAKK